MKVWWLVVRWSLVMLVCYYLCVICYVLGYERVLWRLLNENECSEYVVCEGVSSVDGLS